MTTRKLCIPVLGFLILAFPATATAATRYADPSGTGSSCTQGSPCSFSVALFAASNGDEVIVNPGTYSVSGFGPLANPNLNIHGAAGQPRPVINSTVGFGSSPFYLQNGTTMSHLTINQAPGSATVITSAADGDGLTINDVEMSVGSGAAGITLLGNSLVTNTTINLAGPSGGGTGVTAMNNALVQVRSSTIVSNTTSGLAVATQADGTENATVTVANSIVRAGAGGTDFGAQESGGAATSVINVSYTNWRGVTSISGNGVVNDLGNNDQATAPVFANQAAGDFHQASNSPTVDTGLMDGLTPTVDADGKPRPIGPAADMGAYEYGAVPTVVTGTASSGQPTTATVSGSINTNDSDSTYHFDYGKTTSYGSVTGNGTLLHSLAGADQVSTGLQGLEPYTLYHYRLVSTNQLGTTVGSDATIRTKAGPFSGVKLNRQSIKVSKKRTGKIRMRCPSDTADNCTGTVTISASRRVRGKKRKVSAKASFNIAENKSQNVSFKLSKSQYRALRKAGRMTGKATAKSKDAAGQSKTTTGNVTLKK